MTSWLLVYSWAAMFVWGWCSGLSGDDWRDYPSALLMGMFWPVIMVVLGAMYVLDRLAGRWPR